MAAPGDAQVNALIEQVREANRKDGFPDDAVWTARRLAAMVLYLAPSASTAMLYGHTDWSRFKPAVEPVDHSGMFELPKAGEH
jgi:hypothetical protein